MTGDHPLRRSSDLAPPTSPLTEGELQAIADRQKQRNLLALLGAVVSTVALIAFVIVALVLLGRSDQQQAFSARSDCKTTYSSILGAPVTQRDDLQAQVSELSGDLGAQLGAALLEGEQGTVVTQAQINAFSATKSALQEKTISLEQAITTVSKLPTLAHASQYGFTLNGTHYPACPAAS